MGGVMTGEDLAAHQTTYDTPVCINYRYIPASQMIRGVDVWEMPPNGQGLAALVALVLFLYS